MVGQDRVQLYTPNEKITPEIEAHLHVADCGVSICVEILPYENIVAGLSSLETDSTVSSILVSTGSSYSIYNAIPSSKRVIGENPIHNMKAQKNEVERVGMRRAHVKDGVALCDFLSFLESEIVSGMVWDELSASNKSEEFRAQQLDFVSLSFATISAFGPNGAIIHYEAEESTNALIDTTSLYLIDSGAQFLDGTTDVTRTMHFGDPDPFQIEAYTRVLKGQLDFADVVFPASSRTAYYDIDILARRPLYDVGLDYRHGTSHGIGMFLYVHETTFPYYVLGEFMSDEPGYYEDGAFGIRLENTIEVVEATTPYNFSGPSLTFQHNTLVPYEAKLIDATMLTQRQCTILNEYHSRVLDVVGTEMLNQGRQDGYNWLVTKTTPIAC
ncbi:hypothetical protein Pmani_006911 [Petrolisthes manimaculis]|uniref:Xaa-Pro aminopeptidase n=1 Tax=Petrolisthes manimaculis TaxID=1843537 RepID=A0AAE1UL98_9EUCA|nr:hypothetical protein Pmani_006911 [Petrolisthes manimaculis]